MKATARTLSVPGVVALFALQVADIATTLVGLSRGAHEVGVLAGPALGAVGLASLFLVPFVGMALQLLVVALLPARARTVAWVALLGVTGAVVLGNVGVMLGT